MRRHGTVPDAARLANRRRQGRGWGPFTGAQLTLAFVALAILVGSAVIASATIPNGKTFNACYDKSSGALRLIDKSKGKKCKATEAATNWSKTGAKGATGATGARGPSDAWFAESPFGMSLDSIGTEATLATTATVPIGNYLVNASAEVDGDGTNNQRAACRVTRQTPPSTVNAFNGYVVSTSPDAPNVVWASTHVVSAVANGTTFSVRCSQLSPFGQAMSAFARLSVTQVATTH
jgi:hypothetical protein